MRHTRSGIRSWASKVPASRPSRRCPATRNSAEVESRHIRRWKSFCRWRRRRHSYRSARWRKAHRLALEALDPRRDRGAPAREGRSPACSKRQIKKTRRTRREFRRRAHQFGLMLHLPILNPHDRTRGVRLCVHTLVKDVSPFLHSRPYRKTPIAARSGRRLEGNFTGALRQPRP